MEVPPDGSELTGQGCYHHRRRDEARRCRARRVNVARQAIHTDLAPAKAGFSQAIVAGNMVFVSGTVGCDPVTGAWPAGIKAQGEQALKNLQAVLAASGCSLDDVVK